MPKLDQQILVMFFRDRPQFAAELLRTALQVDVPEGAKATAIDPRWYQAPRTWRRTDAAVLLERGAERLCVLIEVPLRADAKRRQRWPLCVAGMQAFYQCPTYLLVLTPDERVARWARQPQLFGTPDCHFVPLVIGPADVAPITDPARAAAAPELTIFSAMAHPNSLDIVLAALVGNQAFDPDRALLFNDLAVRTLGPPKRGLLRRLIAAGNYRCKREFTRLYPVAEREEAAPRTAHDAADALLEVLRARRLRLSGKDQARIRATTDLAQLHAWLERALKITAVAKLWS